MGASCEGEARLDGLRVQLWPRLAGFWSGGWERHDYNSSASLALKTGLVQSNW